MPERRSATPTDPVRSLGALAGVIHPLDDFYNWSRASLPPFQQVEGPELPEPYRRLLVHSSDMTSTLEHFHEEPVHIRVLSRRKEGDWYYREVVLCRDSDGKPVEFGAIKINLALFPESARQEILEERWPLGRILRELRMTYSSCPNAFLKIASDRTISAALELTGAHVLYGRRNTLLNSSEQPLAEIVEILPPAEAE